MSLDMAHGTSSSTGMTVTGRGTSGSTGKTVTLQRPPSSRVTCLVLSMCRTRVTSYSGEDSGMWILYMGKQ
jgi:hypothetical protein